MNLVDVAFQQFVSHAEAAAGIEHLLRKVKAVLTIEIVDRPCRLGQHIENRQGGTLGSDSTIALISVLYVPSLIATLGRAS